MATDKSYGKHGKKSPGGKGAKKKDLKKLKLPLNWVSKPGDGVNHVSDHDPDSARRIKHG